MEKGEIIQLFPKKTEWHAAANSLTCPMEDQGVTPKIGGKHASPTQDHSAAKTSDSEMV